MTRDWFDIGGVFALVGAVSAIFFRWLRAIERRRDEALRAENERLTGRVAEMERQLAESQEIATERHALIAGPMARSSKLVGERYDAMKVRITELEAERDTATRALRNALAKGSRP